MPSPADLAIRSESSSQGKNSSHVFEPRIGRLTKRIIRVLPAVRGGFGGPLLANAGRAGDPQMTKVP